MERRAPEPAAVTFPALGTTATLVARDGTTLPGARAELDEELADIDRACSRFRDDSEISRVNRSAGAPVMVSPLFLAALQVGLRAAALTDGDVDPTVGSAVRVLGYDRDFSSVAKTGGPLTCVVGRAAGWRTVRIDPRCRTVEIPAGVELDLGATAKAFAADRAARGVPRRRSGTGCWSGWVETLRSPGRRRRAAGRCW